MKNQTIIFYKEFKISLLFLLTAITIVILHLLFHPVRVFDMDTSIFYMDEKYTIASFYTTITAFLIGFMGLINLKKSKIILKTASDITFALFFIALAFDEYFEVHEFINTLVKASLNKESIFKTLSNMSWIFPLLWIIISVFILLATKIKMSSMEIRLPLILGTLCFFLILIFELLGSLTYGQNIYLYFVAIEEGLEMVSMSLFLKATLIEIKLNSI